jgi:hypothetical protein
MNTFCVILSENVAILYLPSPAASPFSLSLVNEEAPYNL